MSKPLMRGINFSFGKIGKTWLSFKYEKLLNFCHRCGSLGHIEKESTDKLYEKKSCGGGQKKNGLWIRVDGYRFGENRIGYVFLGLKHVISDEVDGEALRHFPAWAGISR
ncbi:zf-CCHC_4 domain-containing protein [Cephalotus follicularis]|uniref:Zf-CCHC_4 domain-containing protein n=1 Tax=Cephalotus follicularis TaxID=3775 RepID=A0A1Q3D553_CEPFO|nr:zf-CCHC_4 domain-containing protein [Cephalotus follicularis]